jgi:hypothetical protein
LCFKRRQLTALICLRKSDQVLLLKHYYKVKVPAAAKIADLRVLFTSTVAVALVTGHVTAVLVDAALGVGVAPADEVKFLSSDDDDDDDEDK